MTQLADGRVLVGHPQPDALAGALHEDVVQLGRLGARDAHEQAVELGALDVLDRRVRQMRNCLGLELREPVGRK